MLNLITMIEYINSFLLLTLFGIICYIYQKCKIFSRAINIVMDSVIPNQLSKIEIFGRKARVDQAVTVWLT